MLAPSAQQGKPAFSSSVLPPGVRASQPVSNTLIVTLGDTLGDKTLIVTASCSHVTQCILDSNIKIEKNPPCQMRT